LLLVDSRVRVGDTGFDALAHAFEALWSLHSNQVSDALAFRAIDYCAKFLLRYYRDSGDRDAAEGMALAASLAGMAFSTTFTAACHRLSYPIGRRFKISHGASCGMTLHLVAQVNKNAVAQKFSDLAQVLKLASADAIPEFIWNIRRNLPTIKSFRELRATTEDIEEISKNAYAPLMGNNPVPLNEVEIFNLLVAEIT
jgi:alcohol dehydrogenase